MGNVGYSSNSAGGWHYTHSSVFVRYS
jgi:hypothetical protein